MKNEKVHLGSRQMVNPENIKLLQADINYTIVYLLDGRRILVSTNMGIIESRLPQEQFVRINRGMVVNRSAVLHYFIRPDFDEVKLADASFLKVSRRRKDTVRASLEHILTYTIN